MSQRVQDIAMKVVSVLVGIPVSLLTIALMAPPRLMPGPVEWLVAFGLGYLFAVIAIWLVMVWLCLLERFCCLVWRCVRGNPIATKSSNT